MSRLVVAFCKPSRPEFNQKKKQLTSSFFSFPTGCP